MDNTIEDQTSIILDSIADGVFTVDRDWRITSLNKAAVKITGISREEAAGRYCWEVFRASICEDQCSLRRTIETGQQIVNQSIFIVNSKGDRVPVSISTALLKDKEGNIIGGVETFRDLTLVEELKKEISGRHSFQDIISKNKQMIRLFSMLEQVSESDVTVLLEGESGTGKELFAKAIHSLSKRKNGPMITVNCGALPDSLLESELFGYKAGAFTDAKKDKPGRIALAEGGTLFLDEAADLSPALQVRLLRVLQDRIYEPLGSTRPVKADVRVIAATNKKLEELVKEGGFREDLYYRINVFKLALPPLRNRKEDIPMLCDHFIRKYGRLMEKDVQAISPEALHILMSHNFPGNIRELENIIEYAIVICREEKIGIEHLPEYLSLGSSVSHRIIEKEKHYKPVSLDEMERNFILDLLEQNRWNRKKTAAKLGMHSTTLWRKIKRLNIGIPKKGTA